MSGPVVISAALTGVLATREQCPAIPYTPKEIADEAKRATDAGHTAKAAPLIDPGVLRARYQFSLIMGVLGGIPGSARHLVNQVDTLPPGSHWQVIGIGLNQWRLVAAAIAMGGNVRVGLEDNFYVEAGSMAKSNADLVEKAVRLARDEGREVASVEQARQILCLNATRRLS